ncbi:MAG: class A beta-lactamase-related serine hydrolase, partial [Planctomycetota bacterium]
MLLFAVAAPIPCLAQGAAAPADPEKPAGALNELLAPIRERQKLPALAAGLVRGSRLAAWGVVGVRSVGDETPARLDDRFHLGSCGKSMTATLCARLVERGVLRWDTTIGEALPQLAPEIHPDFRGVTLEQLLCHRSGLPEDRRPTPLLWKLRGLKGPLPEQRVEMVRLVLKPPPATKPGTTFAYANYGYAVAGAMVEAATGD